MTTDGDILSNDIVNRYKQFDINNKNNAKLGYDSFHNGTGPNINIIDLKNNGFNTNVFVGSHPMSESGGVTSLGCMIGSGIGDEFKVDLVDTVKRDTAFDICKKSAQLAKMPFFSIGTGNSGDSSSSNYTCYIGDNDFISTYNQNGPALMTHEIGTYNTREMREKMNLGDNDEIRNDGGYIKIEDGNLKIYNSAGTLLSFENTEYIKTANLYSIRDDVIIDGISKYTTDAEFIDNVIACSDTSYIKKNFSKITSNLRYNHLIQPDLDANKSDVDIQTICNDLEKCVGYQKLVHVDGTISWILFSDGYKKLEVVENASRVVSDISQSSMYLKPDNVVTSSLIMNNDGTVVLRVGLNESIIMSSPKNQSSTYKRNKLFLNRTIKDSQGIPKNYLTNGERLGPGQFISSPNGMFRAIFTENGVLALETSIMSCPTDDRGNNLPGGSDAIDASDRSDAVYMVNDYRYSLQTNTSPPPIESSSDNMLNKIEKSTKLQCINACNNDTRCKSLSFYNPKKTQYNCMLYTNNSNQLTETKDATYMTKNLGTKESSDEDNMKSGYINESGELYTYSPEQITYEYTNETDSKPGDWRNGFTWNKDTYISKNDMTRLETEAMFVNKSEPVNGEMNEDMCAQLCSTDDYCKEFVFYENPGDKIQCGIIKTGAKYDKIPSEHGSTYTRIPRVKDSETSISVPRYMINIASNTWKSLPNPSGEMGPEIMGPKAILARQTDFINKETISDGFTTIAGGTRRIPDIEKLKQMLRERKRTTSSSLNTLRYAGDMEGMTTLVDDLIKAENNHTQTKHHIQAMHDTSYIEMERQNTITANLVVLAAVTAILGAEIIRYAYNK